MPEAVRLVIWDLDGTFWDGTLTEGGITYNAANHDLVIELAKRGIVSAVCSKNNLDDVKDVLVHKGIWDYFVFPSIDWTPKGPRIRALIDNIQLRPETVLLIDDNPLNRKEAEHFVPGIQTADVDIIPSLSASPLFRGKLDEALSRLGQYKLLETRKADEAIADDNREFLRSCNIRVEIEHDVEAHLDRAIELINRTNQLNFIKKRLPEDAAKAREKLSEALAHFATQAGLVRVTDRYGDYGYCGFYLADTRRGHTRLKQFCFSCRILNMGVERWLYQKLGRPNIEIAGEVLGDLNDQEPVDWINSANDQTRNEKESGARSPRRIFIRGSCNVAPLLHYFQLDSNDVIGEFNEVRDTVSIRRDHSLILRYAIEGLDQQRFTVLRKLGYKRQDFKTEFISADPSTLRILAFWIDAQDIVFRDRETGLLVPFEIRGLGARRDKLMQTASESTGSEDLSPRARRTLGNLKEDFDYVGAVPPEEYARTLDTIFDALPRGQQVFVICPKEEGLGARGSRVAALNRSILEAKTRHPDKIVLIAFPDMIFDGDPEWPGHYHRKAYYELYRAVCAHLESAEPDTPKAARRIPERTEPFAASRS